MHPIRIAVIVADSEAIILDDVFREGSAVEASDGAIGMEIVASPAWVCDDGVRGDEAGEDGEEGRRYER